MQPRRLLFALTFVAAAMFSAHAQQNRLITPGDNLVAEGIPPIPASLADEVQRYTVSRPALLADWHPGRREMLISTRFGNTAQIHQVKNPGAARTQLTFFDDPITRATFDAEEARYFIFLKDVGGNEFAQLYRFDLSTGRETLLTDGGRSQNGDVIWNRKGNQIAYASTRRNGTDRDVYVMSPSRPADNRLVLQGTGGGWYPLDWSPDDSQLLVLEYISVTKTVLWLVDAATGGKRPLTDPNERVAWSNSEGTRSQFSRDGRTVFVTSDKDSEFQRLGEIDVASGQFTALTAGFAWDVEAFDVARDGKTVAFVVNEGGISKLHLLDTVVRSSRPISSVPAGVISRLRWHSNGRDLGFTLATARGPSDVYSVDAITGAVSRWTDGELGGLIASVLI
jgi:dipeptidyl aminopeptidase/acylaminoacyl peptidase